MSDLNDIYSALMSAKASNEALETWVRGPDARDTVRNREFDINRGIAAYHRLSEQLRDGRKHIEASEERELTACECNAPNAAPPCSWCTDPDREPQ